jgi:large subunit ribosomal protein L15
MNLSDIHRGVRKNRARKRLGRGIGSGQGKTAGRGHKGQKSRAGTSYSPVFQGGTANTVIKVPKRGFHNKWAIRIAAVNVAALEEHFSAGDEVTPAALVARNLTKGRFDQLKMLGDGALTKKLKVSAHRFSESAKEKIEKAGGQAIVLPGPAPVVKFEKRVKSEKSTQQKSSAAATTKKKK